MFALNNQGTFNSAYIFLGAFKGQDRSSRHKGNCFLQVGRPQENISFNNIGVPAQYNCFQEILKLQSYQLFKECTTRSHTPGPGLQMPGPRSQVPGSRSQVPGPKSHVPGLKSQVPGPKSTVHSLSLLVLALKPQVSGPLSLVTLTKLLL